MKIIVDHRRTKVFFDEEKEQYIKEFHPKLSFRMKYFFRLRRYPGSNFKFIAHELKSLGIKTPNIVFADKYKVVTEKVEGILLSDYLKNNEDDILIKYLDLIVKVLKSDIYFGDFHSGNFIVKNGDIYALDLEDYKKEKFFKKNLDEVLKRLKDKLKNEKWYSYIESRVR